MRDIKFRVWADNLYGEGKRWYYFTLDMLLIAPHVVGHMQDKLPLPDGIECTCQYTGLKDKNGKEIYEGDVLRMWGGSELRFVGTTQDDWEMFYYNTGERIIDITEAEIIGNIYENPEILEDI